MNVEMTADFNEIKKNRRKKTTTKKKKNQI